MIGALADNVSDKVKKIDLFNGIVLFILGTAAVDKNAVPHNRQFLLSNCGSTNVCSLKKRKNNSCCVAS